MPVTVVVGAQWGDEGKAKVIDLLAKEHGYVVRYQGGHNAGHTVVVGDERYALQLVPSGILYDHIVPVIANGVVVDLPTLFAEIDMLETRGISCERLVVSSHAHLIFPWVKGDLICVYLLFLRNLRSENRCGFPDSCCCRSHYQFSPGGMPEGCRV